MVMDLILGKNKNTLFSEDNRLIKIEPKTTSRVTTKDEIISKTRKRIEEETEPIVRKPRINNAIGINQFDRLF